MKDYAHQLGIQRAQEAQGYNTSLTPEQPHHSKTDVKRMDQYEDKWRDLGHGNIVCGMRDRLKTLERPANDFKGSGDQISGDKDERESLENHLLVLLFMVMTPTEKHKLDQWVRQFVKCCKKDLWLLDLGRFELDENVEFVSEVPVDGMTKDYLVKYVNYYNTNRFWNNYDFWMTSIHDKKGWRVVEYAKLFLKDKTYTSDDNTDKGSWEGNVVQVCQDDDIFLH